MPLLDQINLFTRRFIQTNPQIYDNLFNHDPLTAMLKGTLKENFNGGSKIQENILVDAQPGGAYLKGKNFNITQKQNEQALQFNMKFFETAVTLYSEDIKVLNTGPLAVVNLMKTRISEGFMTLNAQFAISSYLNGQQAGYEANPNGFAEALNDGTTPAWDGNTYTSYGDLSRASFGANINSVPVNLAGGSITYDTLNNTYWSNCTQGSGEWEPNLVVTTPKGYALIQNKFQTQQRFQSVKADIGFTGMQFNGSTILATRYMPGSDIVSTSSRANKVAVQYLSETSNGAITAYPSSGITTNGVVGETLLILNARPKKIHMYISTNDMYNEGFRDFVPTANTTVVTGLCLLAANMTVPTPYLHNWINNFTS